MNLIYQIFPNLEKLGPELLECIWATVQMVLISGFISFVFGIFFGSLLIVTKKGGILECLPVYTIIDKAIDILRSVPFIIMLFLLIPLTRIIMGTSLGIEGALVPLIFGTVPFFSRQVETAIAEVDPGLVGSKRGHGTSPIEIISQFISGKYTRHSEGINDHSYKPHKPHHHGRHRWSRRSRRLRHTLRLSANTCMT